MDYMIQSHAPLQSYELVNRAWNIPCLYYRFVYLEPWTWHAGLLHTTHTWPYMKGIISLGPLYILLFLLHLP